MLGRFRCSLSPTRKWEGQSELGFSYSHFRVYLATTASVEVERKFSTWKCFCWTTHVFPANIISQIPLLSSDKYRKYQPYYKSAWGGGFSKRLDCKFNLKFRRNTHLASSHVPSTSHQQPRSFSTLRKREVGEAIDNKEVKNKITSFTVIKRRLLPNACVHGEWKHATMPSSKHIFPFCMPCRCF